MRKETLLCLSSATQIPPGQSGLQAHPPLIFGLVSQTKLPRVCVAFFADCLRTPSHPLPCRQTPCHKPDTLVDSRKLRTHLLQVEPPPYAFALCFLRTPLTALVDDSECR